MALARELQRYWRDKALLSNSRGDITVREAGRMGGLAVLRKRGRPFFVEIGKKGQLAMRASTQVWPANGGGWEDARGSHL